jgi:hypothetical protein
MSEWFVTHASEIFALAMGYWGCRILQAIDRWARIDPYEPVSDEESP